jgi:hypothetical protein
MGAIGDYRRRRAAKRWQRWTEVEPEEDFARRAGIFTMIFVIFMLLLLVLIVVGVVLAVA